MPPPRHTGAQHEDIVPSRPPVSPHRPRTLPRRLARVNRAIVPLDQAEGWKLWASTVCLSFKIFIFVYIFRNCCNILKSIENGIQLQKIQRTLDESSRVDLHKEPNLIRYYSIMHCTKL
jgi:hypothetical protein